MNMKTEQINWSNFFSSMPCDDALYWLERNGYTSLDKAWQACERPDWLLWALTYRNDGYALTKKQLIAIGVRMIRETPLNDGRTFFDLLTDQRSIDAVTIAEQYIVGDATESKRRGAIFEACKPFGKAAYAAYYAAIGAPLTVYENIASMVEASTGYDVMPAQANIIRNFWPDWTPQEKGE